MKGCRQHKRIHHFWTVSAQMLLEFLMENSFFHIFQDQFTSSISNGTWTNIIQSMPPVWNAAETDAFSSRQQPYWSERSSPSRGFSVHSFLLNSLDGATRYEVIIQSKNKFGWSEQTRPFIFTTRFQGEEFMRPF